MAIDLTTEQKELGRTNFQRVVGRHYELSRRDFMKGLLAAGTVLPISAAVYFGYEKLHGNPVKAGLIGAGDEGGVLVGNHSPDYIKFIGVADIRPSNMDRIFKGEGKPPRLGLEKMYGKETAHKETVKYDDYKKLLENKDIEMVVIALPLHLHAPIAIDA